MPIIKTTEFGDMQWDISLKGGNDEFQWNIRLSSIVEGEAGTGQPCHDVLNRGWELVGPVFKSRSEGARYLGCEGKNENAAKNMDKLVEEYNGLFSDEIQTQRRFYPEDKRKFGRPSQGRDRRMQFSTSAKIESWLESQRQGSESVSQVIHRFLEEEMKNAKN